LARKQEKLLGDVTTLGQELALPLRGKLIPSRCCASIKVDFFCAVMSLAAEAFVSQIAGDVYACVQCSETIGVLVGCVKDGRVKMIFCNITSFHHSHLISLHIS